MFTEDCGACVFANLYVQWSCIFRVVVCVCGFLCRLGVRLVHMRAFFVSNNINSGLLQATGSVYKH